MSSARKAFDASFIEGKRQELIELRIALQKTARAAETEEDVIKAAAQQSHEFEDDAQKLDALENKGLLINHSVERLARIDRALAKIDDGTYGFSDISGERIPEERLTAVPEAIHTLDEQKQSELAE